MILKPTTLIVFQLAMISLCITPSINLGFDNSTKDVKGKHLDIIENGRVIARYMYAHDLSSKESRHDTYKPYLHVMAADGKTPITKGPGGQYTHHRGIFLGWNRIKYQNKSIDLWHMKTSEIIHREFLEANSSPEKTTVKVRLDWMDDEGNTILEETRTMVFGHQDSEALFSGEFTCELVASNSTVELNGDPEHAGFQFRPHNDVSRNKSAKYLFHEEGINPKNDKDLPWVALNYKLNGKSYSVQHMNHPENPRGSIYSAYRDYGRFGAFPKIKLEKGQKTVLKYKIRVCQGDLPERSKLSEQYNHYLK